MNDKKRKVFIEISIFLCVIGLVRKWYEECFLLRDLCIIIRILFKDFNYNLFVIRGKKIIIFVYSVC